MSLLNSSVPAQPSAGSSDSGEPPQTDPNLQKIEQGVEQNIKPQDRQAYLAIVVAGNRILFAQETMQTLIKSVRDPNFLQLLPGKMANLMALISNHSGKNQQGQPLMNPVLIVPASIVLACHVMGFAEKAANLQINPQNTAQTLHDVTFAVLQKFGIGQQQIDQVKQQHAQPPVQPQAQQPQIPPNPGA